MIAKIIDSSTIHVFDKTQFDWYAIRNCGQIFRDPDCRLTELDDKIVISGRDGEAESLWNYFDLDTDYGAIKEELSCFSVLKQAISIGGGIRILRQPIQQTIISFIISANNNIKRFSKTIQCIDFSRLAGYTEDDFRALGCGYRAPYLTKTIGALSELCLDKGADISAIKKQLTSLCGVGKKVCDCILLFSDFLDNDRRFRICPIDTWISKARRELGEEQFNAIATHKYAGVAQQYLFYLPRAATPPPSKT